MGEIRADLQLSSQSKWTWIERARRETQSWKKDGEFIFEHTMSFNTEARCGITKLETMEFEEFHCDE